MQAEIVCLRQARRYRAQTGQVGQSIETIHDSDVVAKLKEYAVLLTEVEQIGNTLRQTLLARLQDPSKERSLSTTATRHRPSLAVRRLLQQPQSIPFVDDLHGVGGAQLAMEASRSLPSDEGPGPLREGQIAGQLGEHD
jgi:hypothetical protein